MLWRAITHRPRTRREPNVNRREQPYVSREEIARLAYSHWEARGCQDGSSADDWFRAERELWEAKTGGRST
jgi:Protein of unknown function (DUF2934)